MKKKLLNSLFVIVIISAFAINYSFNIATINPNSTTSVMPDSLMHIFKRACMDCHSDGGNVMAESKVNFSKWNEYSSDKQSQKANKICNVLSEERMPPNGWRKANEKSIPTKKEVNDICKWATSLNTGK